MTALLGSAERGLGAIGGDRRARRHVIADGFEYKQGREGGFDPHARIPDMDLDGIDAAFLYPSIGLFAGGIQDPELAAAICRAYNRWLADYCKPYPDRLFGVAMLPMQDRSTWRSRRCASRARSWGCAAASCGPTPTTTR